MIRLVILVCLLSASTLHSGYAKDREFPPAHMYVELATDRNRLSHSWLEAIKSRLDRKTIDSLAALVRPLSEQELAWAKLIESRLFAWNAFRDSLTVPFQHIPCSDTIRILLGSRWVDDGFTFELNTVCFDLTALQANYGNATDEENKQRIDRLFAHEFTHLIHKTWFRKTGYQPVTFRDSIFRECMYEGIGMYRSLSPKWFPVNGKLPDVTNKVLEELAPVFRNRIKTLDSPGELTQEQKAQIQQGLSRGPVHKKWGAFTIAIWLAQEAKGDDRLLIPVITMHPEQAIRYLAAKYN